MKKRGLALLSILVLVFSMFSIAVNAAEIFDSVYNVGNHDYLCKEGMVTECCGEDECTSTLGGDQFHTGGGPISFEYGDITDVYYCASDATWTTDLDVKDKTTCEDAYGFKWTGSLCCSEADDPNEYYNDVEDGCWNSTEILSDQSPTDKDDVKNYNGQFFGCKLDAENFISDNQDLLSLTDYHTGEQLVKNMDYCHTLGEDYFCSYTEVWKGGVRAGMHLSYVPWNQQLSEGTCEDDFDCSFDKPNCVDGICEGCKTSVCESGHSGGTSFCCEKSKANKQTGTHYSQYDDKNFECWSECNSDLECNYDQDCPFDKPSCVNGECIGCMNNGCTEQEGIQAFCCKTGTGSGFHYDQYDDKNYECRSTCNSGAECCEASQCFDGQKCVFNQANNAASKPYNGHRCVNGAWKEANEASDPSGTVSGYCPLDDQCLVKLPEQGGDSSDNNNPDGNPQCITAGQFIGDDYCDNGIWTSRTKLVGSKMLSLPQGDHTLFCGSYQETLNYLDYVVKDNRLAKEYVSEPNYYANNFCILIYDDKIVFGTTINHPTTEQHFMETLYTTSCLDAPFNGKYNKCASSNAWYNKNSNSIIYSRSTIDLPDTNTLDDFNQKLKVPVQNMLNKIQSQTQPYDTSVFDRGFNTFKEVYINQKGSKRILAAMEGRHTRNIAAEYINFNTDICEPIEAYNTYYSVHWSQDESKIHCVKENNNYYVLVEGSSRTNIDPAIIWPDLTAKLRLG